MTVKLGDIVESSGSVFLVVQPIKGSGFKWGNLCLQSSTNSKYYQLAVDGSWDIDGGIKAGHTRIIGNIFDKE